MPFHKTKAWGKVKPPPGSAVEWGDPISAGLAGCWLLNESGGKVVSDLAKKNHGSIIGTTSWVQGKFGETLAFDGSTCYVDCGANQNLHVLSARLSISAWVRRNASNSIGTLVARGTGAGHGGWIVGLGVAAATVNQIKATKYGVVDIFLGTFPADTLWHHLVLTYSGAGVALYIDGLLNATNGDTSDFSSGDTEALLFGTTRTDGAAGDFFTGNIDNVRVYKRTLLSTEAMRLYVDPFAGIVEPYRRTREQGFATPAAPGTSPPLGAAPRAIRKLLANAEDEGRFNELDVRNWWFEAFA